MTFRENMIQVLSASDLDYMLSKQLLADLLAIDNLEKALQEVNIKLQLLYRYTVLLLNKFLQMYMYCHILFT